MCALFGEVVAPTIVAAGVILGLAAATVGADILGAAAVLAAILALAEVHTLVALVMGLGARVALVARP